MLLLIIPPQYAPVVAGVRGLPGKDVFSHGEVLSHFFSIS